MASKVIPSGETSTGLVLTKTTLNVLNGASALDTRINSAGSMVVSSGGEAYDTTVNSAGKMIVNYMGYASGVVVSHGANLAIASDGSAFAIKEEGGIVSWDSGAVVSFVPSEFSNYVFSGIGVAGHATIHSGTTAISPTITNSGWVKVYLGGLVTDAHLKIWGDLLVYSGGEARDTILDSSAELDVYSGGSASSTVVSSGARLEVASGGTAVAVKEEGGIVSWDSGAVVSFVPSVFSNYVFSGIGIGGHATIHSGTTAASPTITNSGWVKVYLGGLVTDAHLKNWGNLLVYSGGEARDTILDSSAELDVYSGGSASSTVVSSGARLEVASGGTAVAVKEEGGIVSWDSGAVVSFVPSVFSNYVFSGIGIGGHATIHSGTTAASPTITNSGWVKVYLGGLVTDAHLKKWGDLLVYSGGAARDTILDSSAELDVHSGGGAFDTVINPSAKMIVASGGYADGATVSSGGVLTVSSGGLITGRVKVINGAKVSASTGAIIDFDLTRTVPGDTALVNNLSLISGAPAFTLTASGDLDTGNYVLAGGASGFSKSITVYDSESVFSYGTFTVGESVRVGNLSYTLYLSGSDLAVSVVEVPPDYVAPTVTNIKANSVDPTNQNVIVTATFEDDVALASSLYKIGEDGEWTPYENGVTVTSNTTVYFMAVDAAGNESAMAWYKVGNIDKEAPAAPSVSADITETTTGTVTVSAAFSPDSVLREYSFDRVEWNPYTTGITFNSNGRVYFRGTDEAGNISDVISYSVNNIEDAEKEPDLGFYWPDSWYSGVMVAPSTDSNPGTAQTLLDHKYLYLNFATANWGDLPSNPYSVEVYLDGDYCRSISRDSLDGRYYYATEDINIGSFGVGTHDVELRIVTDGYDDDLADNVYGTTFSVQQDEAGEFYKGYYGGSLGYLKCETTLSLDSGKYVIGGDFIGSEAGKKVNAKITIYDSRNKKIGTVSVRKGKVAYKEFVLSDGTYNIQVISTDKQKTADRIHLTVTGEVYYKRDLNDNSIAAVKDEYPFIATVQDVPRTLVSDGWVGFGDVLSFRQVDFEYAGKYTFTAKSSDKVKISLISVTVDGKGRSKEKSVASTTISGKKIGKSIEFGGILLKRGTYYLRVEALGASKGTNADFSVKISSSSTIFSACDNRGDDWLYKSKTKELNKSVSDATALELAPGEILFDGTAANDEWSNFVGYGDEADYLKIHLSNTSTLRFNVSATGAVKLVVYSLDPGRKAGTYTLKSHQGTSFKPGRGKTSVSDWTKPLSLAAGDYYLCLESTDAKKGGCAYYNVSVELNSLVARKDASALTGPEDPATTDESALAGFDMRNVLSGSPDSVCDQGIGLCGADPFADAFPVDGFTSRESFRETGNGLLASL